MYISMKNLHLSRHEIVKYIVWVSYFKLGSIYVGWLFDDENWGRIFSIVFTVR